MSTLSNEALRHLLLDMISSSRLPSPDSAPVLNNEDWQTIALMAKQHRLEPILHKKWVKTYDHLGIPLELRNRWSTAYRKWTMRAMSARHGIEKLHDILTVEKIPYAALKGAWLSQHAYPEPAYRPMRDIDIIVPKDRAIKVFERLIKAGYKRQPKDVTSLEYALHNSKHLPVLFCPHSKCAVEVHSRLTIADSPLSDSHALIERHIKEPSDDTSIQYLSQTDMLVHLIVHAAYDNKFDNGPLVLNDIRALLMASPIDWDRFWQMAESGDWKKGCQLVLALTSHYHQGLAIPNLQNIYQSVPDQVLSNASMLMLMNSEDQAAFSVQYDLSKALTSSNRLTIFFNRVLPKKHILARFAGLPLHSKWVWAHYPLWGISKLKLRLLTKMNANFKTDLKRTLQLDKWLER